MVVKVLAQGAFAIRPNYARSHLSRSLSVNYLDPSVTNLEQQRADSRLKKIATVVRVLECRAKRQSSFDRGELMLLDALNGALDVHVAGLLAGPDLTSSQKRRIYSTFD